MLRQGWGSSIRNPERSMSFQACYHSHSMPEPASGGPPAFRSPSTSLTRANLVEGVFARVGGICKGGCDRWVLGGELDPSVPCRCRSHAYRECKAFTGHTDLF